MAILVFFETDLLLVLLHRMHAFSEERILEDKPELVTGPMR